VSTRFTRPARARRALLAMTAAATLAAATACAASSSSAPSGAAAGQDGAPVIVDSSPSSLFDGIVLGTPLAKPAVTLTDAEGRPYNLATGTAGKLTLVYFGYTHCPDVCPTTMATLASTLDLLTPAQRAKIDVVFITTDPARDTPAVIKDWLNQFYPGLIGLTGPFATIQRAAASVGIAIQKPVPLPGGGYTVTHGALVLAFNTDGKAHVAYTAGETVPQFRHDIPLLLAGRDLTAQ
jgi:protein SCO1/2